MASEESQAFKKSNVFNFGEQEWLWKQRATPSLDTSDVLDELKLGPDDDFVGGWRKAGSSIPSEVHVELLKIGAIPDPYIGFNEHKVQWIGDVEWLYQCHFHFDPSLSQKHALLVFEGLDTLCDVYLNAEKILSTNNQFRTYTYPASESATTQKDLLSILKAENTLFLHFKSAKALAKAEEAKYGKVRAGSNNLGDPSRVYVRKAQYDWRWDWGPELMTCGPYRPIKLITYDVRISDVHARTKVSIPPENNYSAGLSVDVTLSGSLQAFSGNLLVQLFDKDGNTIKLADSKIQGNPQVEGGNVVKDTVVSWNDLREHGVELWWPVGYGKQTLYSVEISLVSSEGEVLDVKSKRIGFRTAELIQEPLTEPDQYGTGTTFLFEVNGVRMFMGGSNWVPADNFLTTISDERYRAWLTLLRDGNQNMVRIWGGGIYEPDVFYDICDELGILVWQDFQFACGVYPAHEDFVVSVKREAEDNVLRLRHHPSIVCFCGNNEDYQMVLQWGGIDQLPARVLYEHVFPEIVSRLTDPPIPYHRGSPYGGEGWDTSDPTVGDVHQWNVWGGKELQYQEYDKLGGRFVSEFGIPAMPSMSTIKYWMKGAPASQWYSQSHLMAQHTKAGAFERRFAIVMNENFRLTSDFETHAFNTQLMQSEAVGFAYRSWRREWRGRGKEYTAGVLVWQLNDCWPVVSWAIADYFLRPKPIYYTIARELAPVTVGIFRTVVKNRANDRPRQFYDFGATQSTRAELQIWATNSSLTTIHAKLELRFFDLTSPDWSLEILNDDVTLLPNQTTEMRGFVCPEPPRMGASPGDINYVGSATVVAHARLVDKESGEVLARFANWPEPYRFLEAPDPGLKVKVEAVGGEGDVKSLRLTVERPVKCVVLSVDGDDDQSGKRVKWSDNALDVVPGDGQVVQASGLDGRKIKVAHFGREKASFVGA